MNDLFILCWIAALRGGSYHQCRGKAMQILSTGERQHCVMGVGFDLINPRWREGASDAYVQLISYCDQDLVNRLVALNDNGLSFSQLATVLESWFSKRRGDSIPATVREIFSNDWAVPRFEFKEEELELIEEERSVA